MKSNNRRNVFAHNESLWLLSLYIDDFTNCPTHRSNLGVGWNRGSNSRCRVPKEMSGHGKGRVKSIPKADRGVGKRVSQIVLKMSGKFDWELVNRLPKIQTEAEFSEVMSEHFVGFPPSGGTRNYAHGGKGPFRTSN